MEGRARRADRSAAELRSGDGLILHYSVWSRVVDDALAATGPLAVCYHNVTRGTSCAPGTRVSPTPATGGGRRCPGWRAARSR